MPSTTARRAVVLVLAAVATLTVGCSRIENTDAADRKDSVAGPADAGRAQAVTGEQRPGKPRPRDPAEVVPGGAGEQGDRTKVAGVPVSADRALAADEVARRLGPVFGVDPAAVAVQARPIEYIRMRALEASLPQHDPPLYVLVEATSGEILYVNYKWPGASQSGLFPVPEGGPRTPALDQEVAERVAGAAIEQCLGGVPKGYELVEATYNDMHLYLRYVFRWQEVAEGVRLPHRIRVTVDGVKGKVASLSRLVYPVTVPLRPRVARETAIQTALEHCRPFLQTGETLATPEAILQVDFAHSTKHPDRQFLMWSMKVFTAGPAPRMVLGVEVDAVSGDVVGELLPGGGPAPAAEAGQQAGAASAARV
jgi:hypothetical protein